MLKFVFRTNSIAFWDIPFWLIFIEKTNDNQIDEEISEEDIHKQHGNCKYDTPLSAILSMSTRFP